MFRQEAQHIHEKILISTKTLLSDEQSFLIYFVKYLAFGSLMNVL